VSGEEVAEMDHRDVLHETGSLDVRRIAGTSHYDGVKKEASEPAVIGLFGIAPVQFELVDPSKPGWRKL
jgi:hypothetical protein